MTLKKSKTHRVRGFLKGQLGKVMQESQQIAAMVARNFFVSPDYKKAAKDYKNSGEDAEHFDPASPLSIQFHVIII